MSTCVFVMDMANIPARLIIVARLIIAARLIIVARLIVAARLIIIAHLMLVETSTSHSASSTYYSVYPSPSN